MFDTTLTVVGMVISNPERRRTENTGSSVTNFRIASTSRRFDRATEKWTDRDTLFLKITCWRQLGNNVFNSVYRGRTRWTPARWAMT